MNKIMEYMVFAKPIVAFDLTEHRFSAQEAAFMCSRMMCKNLPRQCSACR
jgi:hypothetical protein